MSFRRSLVIESAVSSFEQHTKSDVVGFIFRIKKMSSQPRDNGGAMVYSNKNKNKSSGSGSSSKESDKSTTALHRLLTEKENEKVRYTEMKLKKTVEKYHCFAYDQRPSSAKAGGELSVYRKVLDDEDEIGSGDKAVFLSFDRNMNVADLKKLLLETFDGKNGRRGTQSCNIVYQETILNEYADFSEYVEMDALGIVEMKGTPFKWPRKHIGCIWIVPKFVTPSNDAFAKRGTGRAKPRRRK